MVKKKESRNKRDSQFYELQNITKPPLLSENKSRNRNFARYFVMPCLKNLKDKSNDSFELNKFQGIDFERIVRFVKSKRN